jgi:hypothetical protein
MTKEQEDELLDGEGVKPSKGYFAAIGAKGGKKSRRKLTKKEARRIAMVRWAAGAGRGAVKTCKQSGAGSATTQLPNP